jgi:long-subunit fatty acid transport protein
MPIGPLIGKKGCGKFERFAVTRNVHEMTPKGAEQGARREGGWLLGRERICVEQTAADPPLPIKRLLITSFRFPQAVSAPPSPTCRQKSSRRKRSRFFRCRIGASCLPLSSPSTRGPETPEAHPFRRPDVRSDPVRKKAVPCRAPFPFLIAALLVLGPGASALHANSWRTFGFGPRAVAMGGAFTAVADDFSAGYYNPAGLLVHPNTQFGLCFQYVKEDLMADGIEVESSRDSNGLTLGGSMTIPFTDQLKDRIAFGYYFYQPLFYSLDLQIPETTAPQFPILESMARMQILHLALAVDLIPGLLLGAGLTISSDLGGALDLKPGVSGFGGVEEVISSVDQEVYPILSGTAGLILRPGRYHASLRPFTLGFTWRDQHSLDLSIPVSVILSGFLLRLDMTSTFLYTPMQWVGGFAWQISPDWLLSLDLSFNRWSKYSVPSLSIATQINIPLIVLKQGVNDPPGFRDTWTPRIGTEFCAFRSRWIDGYLRAGYFFEPTPVPEQTGRTNYLDSDRHVFSWGFGLLFNELFGLDLTQKPVSFDVGIAYHWLPDRGNVKAPWVRTDNPGSPEIVGSGNVWFFTCGFTYGTRPGTRGWGERPPEAPEAL